MDEEKEFSKQDAREFVDAADSYLLLTLNDDTPSAAGYANDIDQLLMIAAYLNTNPPLAHNLRLLLSKATPTLPSLGDN
tara:strand:+ start:2848 stop:3084 length:237 start_codon:yes stop_codon:yes gene_type:complete